MLHVSKTVQFKYDSTKPLGQRIVEFDIKGKPVEDNKLYTVALDSFIGKVVADLPSLKVKISNI